ncbi:hypothetical protein LTR56_022620 [Elasticomyces elasticus]|nr:hypothetical protein LTR56_022620 [Elasticomyces elasticus]KAK3628413.1 hypothetical protein LTR22_022374 [Elasticomyces elasticus]KAK4905763.1 hypothetical protein LTR49_024969 [Elasticomyces elasticus]KAK5743225.1 hypothetical protein LTS12_023913 [Elasticomyces elasticus]
MELPRIDFDLREHKLSIAVTWTVLFLSSGALPVILYFALRYGTKLELDTGMKASKPNVVRQLIKDSTGDPHCDTRSREPGIFAHKKLGSAEEELGVSTDEWLPLGCAQLLLAAALVYTRTAAPVTISSVSKGQPVRSGVYAITEDIVAVDGGQGRAFRQQLEARYLASRTIRGLFHRLDLVWGFSAVVVGALSIGLLFGLDSQDAGYVLGWMTPWVYAAAMVGVTRYMVKSALKSEEKDPALQ